MDNERNFTIAIVGVALVLVATVWLLSPKQYPNEPPMAPTAIPVLGHMIGFMRNSFTYYENLRDRFPHPIFTVCMPGRRIYVVTKPDLISKVDKKNKQFTFAPIIKEFSGSALGTSKDADVIMDHNLWGELGKEGLVEDIVVGMREALKPGTQLDHMNTVMAKEITVLLDAIKPEPGRQHRTIQLASFVEHLVTMATTDSVYGPHNPFKDEATRKSFFAFEKGMIRLLVAPFPQYTARKYIAEREKVAQALTEYYRAGHHEQGSGLAKARWDYSVKNGVSVEDIGHFEIGGTIAILLNTLPSVYWMLLTVFLYPALLAELREEIDQALTIDDNTGTITVDITVVKNECPLLLSTLKESLRVRAMGTAVRVVAEDTELDGYVLKKGAMIQIPLGVAHSDLDHWGAEHKNFDPRRFLKDPKSGKKVPDDSGYRAFGGGKHLCPGRWFATNEILGVVALFVSRYEMLPSRGRGWVIPTTKNSNTVAQMETPDFEVDMDIFNREKYEKYKWDVVITASNKVTALLSDDKVGT